jgi:hydrogenase expression/formation protein HypD
LNGRKANLLINKVAINQLAQKIAGKVSYPVRIMEVCGTHTMNIARFGIKQLLPPRIKLISGPGCPICVTDESDIDLIQELSRISGVTVFTFGDLYRVPGSEGSLEKLNGEGADVRIAVSPLEAVYYAEQNPAREAVFIGIGFETTAPLVAVIIDLVRNKGIKNFSVLSFLKRMSPVLMELVRQDENTVDGFLLPGHVSTVIGIDEYQPLAKTWSKPGVVTGFEPVDILEGINAILEQISEKSSRIEIQYKRGVNKEGAPLAREYMSKYFEVCDASWRGLGVILESGLAIRKLYRDYDALYRFNLGKRINKRTQIHPCSCGEILRGMKMPHQCLLFGSICRPDNPIGPCMVSSEGSCAASYNYPTRYQDTLILKG